MKSLAASMALFSMVSMASYACFASAVCSDSSARTVTLDDTRPQITLQGFSDLGIPDGSVLTCAMMGRGVGAAAAPQRCTTGSLVVYMIGMEAGGQATVQLLNSEKEVIFTGSCHR